MHALTWGDLYIKRRTGAGYGAWYRVIWRW